MSNTRYGVLVVNLGTPDAPTTQAVRRYLNRFLSDRRVVDLPPILWQPLLKGLITPIRAPRSANNYQKIWMPTGSPLHVYSDAIVANLRQALSQLSTPHIAVELAMSYSNPSIAEGIRKLEAAHITDLIVLPLYPQYANSTTAAVFDAVVQTLQTSAYLPQLHFIRDYYAHPAYISALQHSVNQHIQEHGKPQKLLLSFHGLPMRAVNKGDPYPSQCEATAKTLAQSLALTSEDWLLCYQSRFGKAAWLPPETLGTLKALPSQGITEVAVICPGFAADCLETLEEIAMLNRNAFLAAGGKQYHYIPALNASPQHIDALIQIIKQFML